MAVMSSSPSHFPIPEQSKLGLYQIVVHYAHTACKVAVADPGFSLGGGGGGERLCARTHITSAKPEVPYTAGVQVKHSDTKWDKKNKKKTY